MSSLSPDVLRVCLLLRGRVDLRQLPRPSLQHPQRAGPGHRQHRPVRLPGCPGHLQEQWAGDCSALWPGHRLQEAHISTVLALFCSLEVSFSMILVLNTALTLLMLHTVRLP